MYINIKMIILIIKSFSKKKFSPNLQMIAINLYLNDKLINKYICVIKLIQMIAIEIFFIEMMII